ncbi:MAG TPA: hypothetical protein VFY13_06855, partial [Luteolibacter sp.]|nr:hypothetical protein [Luteolibacter sp.]
ADFRELIADMITIERLRDLVGNGLGSQKDAVAASFVLDRQKISGEVASIDLEAVRGTIKPSDEELKKYWELIQDSFKTEPQRRFTYLLAAPEPTPEPAATPAENPTGLEQAALSDEAKKKIEKEKAEKEAAVAEARRKAQRDLDTRIDDLTYELEQNKGNDFEACVASKGFKLQSTALFTRSNPPAELDLSLRTGAAGGSALDQLFAMTPTKDLITKISQPLAVGENQWLLAKLEEEIPSRTMTFEEARDKARTQYIEEEARKQLTKTITEAAEKIRSAMASGETFASASSKAGLDKLRPFLKIGSDHQATAPEEPQELFDGARNVEPGTISEPVYSGSRAYLIHVTAREVVSDDKALDQEVKMAANQFRIAAFNDWLLTRVEAADVKRLYSSAP